MVTPRSGERRSVLDIRNVAHGTDIRRCHAPGGFPIVACTDPVRRANTAVGMSLVSLDWRPAQAASAQGVTVVAASLASTAAFTSEVSVARHSSETFSAKPAKSYPT